MIIIDKRLLLILLLIVSFLTIKAQYLEFSKLLSLQKQSLDEINDYLISQGWEYKYSKKLDEIYGGAQIGWVINEKQKDKIFLGLALFNNEGFANELFYYTSKEQYFKLKNCIKSYGYRFYKSYAEDNILQSIYRDSTIEVSFFTKNVKYDGQNEAILYYIRFTDYKDIEKKVKMLNDSINYYDNQIMNIELSKVSDVSKAKVNIRDEKRRKMDSLLSIRDTIIVDYNNFYETKDIKGNISGSITQLFNTEKYYMLSKPFNVKLSVIFNIDSNGITKSDIEIINSNNDDFNNDLGSILKKLKFNKCQVFGVSFNSKLIIQLEVDLSFIIYQVDPDGKISFYNKIPEKKILDKMPKEKMAWKITYYKDKVVQINIDNEEFIKIYGFQEAYDINRLK